MFLAFKFGLSLKMMAFASWVWSLKCFVAMQTLTVIVKADLSSRCYIKLLSRFQPYRPLSVKAYIVQGTPHSYCLLPDRSLLFCSSFLLHVLLCDLQMIESSFWIKNYITVSKGDSKVQASEDHWETRGHVAKCLKYLQMSDDSLSYSNMRGVTASSFAAGIIIESPRMLLANTH